jgi:hypothetical protein
VRNARDAAPAAEGETSSSVVESPTSTPATPSPPIKMEVGIEDCLHIEFEYDKAAYHLSDVVLGRISFLLVRIRLKHMELEVRRRETSGSGASAKSEATTLCKYEIMDGAPVRGETVPIRLCLAPYDLTPTYLNVHNKVKSFERERERERERKKRVFRVFSFWVFSFRFFFSLSALDLSPLDPQKKLKTQNSVLRPLLPQPGAGRRGGPAVLQAAGDHAVAEEGRGRAGVQGRGRVRRLRSGAARGRREPGRCFSRRRCCFSRHCCCFLACCDGDDGAAAADAAAAEGGGGGGSAASSCGGGGGRGEAARGDGDDGCDRRAAAARDTAGCLSFFGLGGFPSFSDSHLFCITGEKRGGDEVPRPLFCKKRGQQSREFFLNLVFRPPGVAKHNPAQHEKRGAGKALRARAAPLLFFLLCNFVQCSTLQWTRPICGRLGRRRCDFEESERVEIHAAGGESRSTHLLFPTTAIHKNTPPSSTQEDAKLLRLVGQYGPKQWSVISSVRFS